MDAFTLTPMANDLPGVNPLEVFRLGAEMTVFRIAKADHVADPLMLESFQSKYEQKRAPKPPELAFTPIYMGISVYLRPQQAAQTARVWPMIGEYIAEVRLNPSIGAAFALTAEPGHLTVWGIPLQLVRSVVDIVPVEEIE